MSLELMHQRCGNGTLTHILISEGYTGEGFDLRARASWSHYPQETQSHLHVQPFSPFESHPQLQPSTFLIGNHADELTPWIPVMSALLPASGYLSIPCCPWSFDTRFERGRTGPFQIPQFDPKSEEHESFIDGLRLGAEGQAGTSYSKYRIWLAYLSQACGWKVECEMLRIPSTRNWAIVGK
jgi:tRNASer (uridine44-2'-O)-methyltransferase